MGKYAYAYQVTTCGKNSEFIKACVLILFYMGENTMLFKVIIDTDSEKTFFQTLVITFENSIESMNHYKVVTTITKYDGSALVKKAEIMNHREALQYMLLLKNNEAENIVGIDFISKQTLITKENPFISHDEYIKRFLWE